MPSRHTEMVKAHIRPIWLIEQAYMSAEVDLDPTSLSSAREVHVQHQPDQTQGTCQQYATADAYKPLAQAQRIQAV